MSLVEVATARDRVDVMAERIPVLWINVHSDDLQVRIIVGDDEEDLVSHLPCFEVRSERAPAGGVIERFRRIAGVLLQLLAGKCHGPVRSPNVSGSTGRLARGKFSTTSR